MAKKILCLALVICGAVQGVHLNVLGSSSPFFGGVQNFGSQLFSERNPFRILSQGASALFPPQRLPVGGLGFSNPPPPVGSGQDPATQTCGLAPPFCARSRYRSIDGSCNNLVKPTLGNPQTPYGRLVPYNYGDGISSFPTSRSGRPLPNPRTCSMIFFPDKNLIDSVWTLITQQWGQIITHDMSLTAGIAQSHKDTVVCCDDNGQLSFDASNNPQCAPILIPPNDPVHAPQGTQCMNFVRTGTTRDRGCTPPFAPAEPLSTVTAFMDLSLVYGSSAAQAAAIRAYQGGRLTTLVRGGQEWPPQDPNVTLTCESAQSRNEPCYLTGDIRTNQNPQLAVLQILLLREHNRLANNLAAMNPHWDDETIFQEARRINIAQYQKINYYEYLPILLGYENMVKNKLIYPGAKGPIKDYNPQVDPSVLDEHATAAFRTFHTLIRGHLELITEHRNNVGAIRLSDWFNRPLVLELDDAFNKLARGLTVQPQDYSDQFWTVEITEFLFKRNNTVGGDLRATDIQRGRDHGLGTYVATRAACGLPVPKSFQDMHDFISKENVEKLQLVYEDYNDVDLVLGGSLENNVVGAQTGPTFLCILTEQFFRTRVGDRYFFENGEEESAFSPSQLESIRNGALMSRIICDNADGVHHMQPHAFQQLTHGNKLVPCEHLPFIDLSLWQDAGIKYGK
ncbi:peroxidase-like isoform X2 [Epargyreus clarus]|uniref:peroxidase-like isoform X2 n=1 Tax=Epargyreus clarus TaxID=520877 RepID=UPI003C2ADA87